MYDLPCSRGFGHRGARELDRPVRAGRADRTFDEGEAVQGPPGLVRFVMRREEHGEMGELVPPGFGDLGPLSPASRRCRPREGTLHPRGNRGSGRRSNARRLLRRQRGRDRGLPRSCEEPAHQSRSAARRDPIHRELRIDERRAGGLPLFRLARRSTLIVVREVLQARIASAKLRGVDFSPAEGCAP